MFGYTIYKAEQADNNLQHVQMMLLAKLGHLMARVDTLEAWIPHIQKMEKRVEALEAKVKELESLHG